MRFTPLLSLLAALARTVSALPTVDDRATSEFCSAEIIERDSTVAIAESANDAISQFKTRGSCTKFPEAGKLVYRTEATLHGFEKCDIEFEGVWYVKGDAFLSSATVTPGERIKVYSLSGCSAIFVIGSDGKPTTFHITAGQEAQLARSAGAYIKAQEKAKKLTPKKIMVYTREGGITNYNDIITALGPDLTKLATHETYNYNPTTAPRTERWQLVLTVGTDVVEAMKYDSSNSKNVNGAPI